MKITFDANVWRIIASPATFPNEPSLKSFLKISDAIDNKRIVPFLSETIFSLEAIQRKERKDFFSDYKAQIKTNIQENKDGSIAVSLQMGPDLTAHPGNNDYLERHLKDASGGNNGVRSCFLHFK